MSLQFEPADGRVCRASCPTLASCTNVLFGEKKLSYFQAINLAYPEWHPLLLLIIFIEMFQTRIISKVLVKKYVIALGSIHFL